MPDTPTARSATTSFVSIDRRSDGVAVLRIDRPGRNALSTVVLNQIRAAADELAADPPGAVVVWGGDEVFSQGGDPTEFDTVDPALARYIGERFHAANSAVAAIPRPTIAAICGVATGGGLELALACDFRVAAANARLGLHEITLGLFPGGGGTQRLPRLVGPARAKYMIFSGEPVSAGEALRIGLVDQVVADGTTLDAAAAWAAALAARRATALELAKQAVDGGLDLPLADGLRLELDLFPRAFGAGAESSRDNRGPMAGA
ncbi:enoyl-CoA hydratase/isomerase family protein [Planotetraspora thailandica]|nr:enoyl-CoA hydratase/isomerase family protein [Planotetraspora thailandica]